MTYPTPYLLSLESVANESYEHWGLIEITVEQFLAMKDSPKVKVSVYNQWDDADSAGDDAAAPFTMIELLGESDEK